MKQRLSGRRKMGPLALALMIQVGVLALAALVVVVVPTSREEPVFTAGKTIYLPQRELEHAAALAEFQQAAASPALMERIQAETMMPDMPVLPSLPTDAFTPFEAENPMQESDALFGDAGLVGDLAGLRTEASKVSFLGIEDSASRIVIAMDVSVTVTNSVSAAGMSMEDIKAEAAKLIEGLNANTLFGFIQHARNYDTFRDYLVPATQANKQAALEWLNTRFRTDGSGRGWKRYEGRNGIEAVLEVAFNMEPDVIYLLSDGDYWRSSPTNERVPFPAIDALVRRRQAALSSDARIHFVGFGVKPENASALRRLTGRNNGRYRQF